MKTNTTQIVILGIFILFIVIGVIVFAKFGTNNTVTSTTTVEVWGTIPEGTFSKILENVNASATSPISVSYKELPPETFESTLIESLADGVGPDLVLIPSTMLLKNQKKFSIIGFDVLSERDFKDTFTQAGEVFLTSDGSYAVPVLTDPLVMYWNRDMLSSNNIARPPTTWEEILKLVPILTKTTDDKRILKSALAFGDYKNVRHFKDVLMALTLQSGGHIIDRDANGNPVNHIGDHVENVANPFSVALGFFTQFSDPLRSVYSWNRSLPEDMQMFLNGDLAFYFGPASEADQIREKNPNLNFDVAPIPEPQNANTKATASTVYGFAILATSQNKAAAYTAAATLAGSNASQYFAAATGLAPVRRDVLSQVPTGAFDAVFWQSALYALGYLDPNPALTSGYLAQTVDDVVTGKTKPADEASIYSRQLDEILK